MALEGHLTRPVAVIVWLIAIGMPACLVGILAISPSPPSDGWAIPVYSAIVATWGLTGAFVATRRPDTGAGGLADTLIAIGNLGFFVCIPASFAAPVVPFRRGTPVERKQLAWFGAAMGLAAAAFICATFLPQPYGVASFVVGMIALGLVPLAIAIAILRCRLYEIDRLVSRTLACALVTALLAAAFVGTNLVLQAVLVDAARGGTTLTTAVSTLVVASLFQPLRRRVQWPVDRRFNRARVDGERVVATFAGQLRDQVDLDRLRAAVVASVDDAVAPVAASVWLRGA